ncbi:MAG: hypothetical protein CUN55_17200, partial [Phototrophicales bacterium]
DSASTFNPQSFLEDPQQLNAYSYVKNNPITFNDPSGKFVNLVAGALIGVAAQATVDIITTGSLGNWKSYVLAASVGALTSGGSAMAIAGSASLKSAAIAATKAIAKEAATEIAIGSGIGTLASITDSNDATVAALIGAGGLIVGSVRATKNSVKLPKPQSVTPQEYVDKLLKINPNAPKHAVNYTRPKNATNNMQRNFVQNRKCSNCKTR